MLKDNNIITYGTNELADYQASISNLSPYLNVSYQNEIIKSQLVGAYNFENILAAICIGKYFNVENEKIKLLLSNMYLKITDLNY